MRQFAHFMIYREGHEIAGKYSKSIAAELTEIVDA